MLPSKCSWRCDCLTGRSLSYVSKSVSAWRNEFTDLFTYRLRIVFGFGIPPIPNFRPLWWIEIFLHIWEINLHYCSIYHNSRAAWRHLETVGPGAWLKDRYEVMHRIISTIKDAPIIVGINVTRCWTCGFKYSTWNAQPVFLLGATSSVQSELMPRLGGGDLGNA